MKYQLAITAAPMRKEKRLGFEMASRHSGSCFASIFSPACHHRFENSRKLSGLAHRSPTLPETLRRIISNLVSQTILARDCEWATQLPRYDPLPHLDFSIAFLSSRLFS